MGLLAAAALAVGCSPNPTVGARPAAADRTPTSPAPASRAAPRPSTGTPAPTPAPTTVSPCGETVPDSVARARTLLSSLTRAQRVAQLFVVGTPLRDLAQGDALARRGVGGIFLQGYSTLAVDAVAQATSRWAREAGPVRPWVATDQEGGNVQALRGPGFGLLPSATDQAALGATRLGDLADQMGASLAAAGVTVDLAPVVDAVPAGTELRNPPIGRHGRQYGSTPDAAAAGAAVVACGLTARRVVPTLKHFPGLGRVSQDTDKAEAVDAVTGPADPQIAAFGRLASASARPFVMVSLATYEKLSKDVAAFSPEIIQVLLRHQLGFDGVVISDDLGNAKAVAAVSPGERAVRFLAAGGTLVLTVRAADLPVMQAAVLARCTRDQAFARQVDAAALTALKAKVTAGLL